MDNPKLESAKDYLLKDTSWVGIFGRIAYFFRSDCIFRRSNKLGLELKFRNTFVQCFSIDKN